MFDEYDTTVRTYDKVLNIYMHDSVPDTVENFIKGIEDTRDLKERLVDVISKLKSALEVLDHRTITNIGGKVHDCVPPENYDPDIGYKTTWYLVQVWR